MKVAYVASSFVSVVKKWVNLMNILTEKDGGDTELLLYAMTLINKVSLLWNIITANSLKRHDQFVAFYFYCKIMLISISYNYCSVLTANKCFIETELTS